MAINSYADIGKAFESGKFHFSYVTKTTMPSSGTAGNYIDLNQTALQPKYNAFAGSQFEFTPLTGSGNGGIYPGSYLSSHKKLLTRWGNISNNTSGTTSPPHEIILADYLGFYPLIDCDDTSPQPLVNSNTLTRYSDGNGVRIVFITQAPMTTTATCTVEYTNQDGTTGRTVSFNVIRGASIGIVASGAVSSTAVAQPYCPLAENDQGVRSIQTITFSSGAGGFICAALVKPIDHIMLYESNVYSEKNYGFEKNRFPEIIEGAYLNMIVRHTSTGAPSLRSELTFVNV